MKARIEILKQKKMIGKKMQMSFAGIKTAELWQSFMPRLSEIRNRIGAELYSLEVYDEPFFRSFSPSNQFAKWAAAEVENFEWVPDDMQTLVVPEGRYAVFNYRGLQSEGAKAYDFIFRTWLPASAYLLDHRPHFAVMGENYRTNDPSSEEEIWIPVQSK